MKVGRLGCIAAFMSALLLSGGCDHRASEDLSIELVTLPPEQASVEVAYPRIRLPAGVVLDVAFRRQGGNQGFPEDQAFVVYSETPSIARPLRTRDKHRFLIVGQKPGDAIFRINLGDRSYGPLRVEVSSPRPEKKRSLHQARAKS